MLVAIDVGNTHIVAWYEGVVAVIGGRLCGSAPSYRCLTAGRQPLDRGLAGSCKRDTDGYARLTPAGETIGFAKVGINELTGALVRGEHETLGRLHAADVRHLQVPTVLGYESWNGLEILVLGALPVWQKRTALSPGRLNQAMTEVAGVAGITRSPLASSEYWSKLTARLEAAGAGLDSAGVTVSSLDPQLKLARDELARTRRLYEQKMASQAARDQSEAQLQRIEREHRIARANLQSAQAKVKQAAASVGGSGDPARDAPEYGTTRAACVCCSITSLTSSAYGSRVERHGSGRFTRAYQSSSATESNPIAAGRYGIPKRKPRKLGRSTCTRLRLRSPKTVQPSMRRQSWKKARRAQRATFMAEAPNLRTWRNSR